MTAYQYTIAYRDWIYKSKYFKDKNLAEKELENSLKSYNNTLNTYVEEIIIPEKFTIMGTVNDNGGDYEDYRLLVDNEIINEFLEQNCYGRKVEISIKVLE